MSHSMLALDLALNSGYMRWKVGDARPVAGLLEIESSLNLGGRLASLFKFVYREVREYGITDISIEEPLIGEGVPGKAKQFHWLISAYGVVCMIAEQVKTNGVSVNVMPIANATMAVHWLGSRDIPKHLRKTQSMLEAQRRGLKLDSNKATDHNKADAAGVLSTRCSQLGICHLTPWDSKRSPGPLFTGAHAPKGTVITQSNKRAAAIILNKGQSFNKGEG